jgi:hypothetical protein
MQVQGPGSSHCLSLRRASELQSSHIRPAGLSGHGLTLPAACVNLRYAVRAGTPTPVS